MASCVHPMGYVCITIYVVALLFGIIGMGIPYWYKGDTTESAGNSGTVKTTIREGLWKKCTDMEYTSDKSSFCVDNEATTIIKAIRWVLFVGLGVLGIAVLAAGAAHMEKNKTAYVVAAIHGLIAAAIKLAVAALYGTVAKDELEFETKHLYAGWALVVLAALLSIVSSLLALLLTRCINTKVEDQDQEKDDK